MESTTSTTATEQPKAAAAATTGAAAVEDKQQSRKRYDHLRQIELKMQVIQRETHEGRAEATPGYEQLEFEDKNKGKFLTTFPYPYMNGYLHLGKYPSVRPMCQICSFCGHSVGLLFITGRSRPFPMTGDPPCPC